MCKTRTIYDKKLTLSDFVVFDSVDCVFAAVAYAYVYIEGNSYFSTSKKYPRLFSNVLKLSISTLSVSDFLPFRLLLLEVWLLMKTW